MIDIILSSSNRTVEHTNIE